ncbi:MAG TPA: isoprenylcysteine carboxylmethyltransferase family protein [Methylocystis sp.]|nr:isoprenylcysteine carboxylmethyltransferase family protein [Methylocystis sp.]
MDRLERNALQKFVVLTAAMAALLFLPAGTLRYWQAWAYLAVFFGAGGTITAYLIRRDRALLERRLSGGPFAEKEPAQKIIMTFMSLGSIALLVVPALDRRFGWSETSAVLALAGELLFLLGYYVVFLTFRENSFAAATIGVFRDQRVIATGPYALVRHPMYAGALVYCAATPLALGSLWGLLAVAAVAPFMLWRIVNEEEILLRRLPGYADYCARVRWRLIPHVF